MWGGNPAVFIREVTADELKAIEKAVVDAKDFGQKHDAAHSLNEEDYDRYRYFVAEKHEYTAPRGPNSWGQD
jgi:hypothetical protein